MSIRSLIIPIAVAAAQELFITDKTASVHVSNILGKLGAANRGEAAALAHSAGFEPVSQAR